MRAHILSVMAALLGAGWMAADSDGRVLDDVVPGDCEEGRVMTARAPRSANGR